jgi:type IX secretion system substrate protein
MNSQVFNLYSMGYVPHNALIDTAGQIIFTNFGYNEPAMISLIENYYQPFLPAIGNNIYLSHGYMQMGIDTLVFTATVDNPENHNFELYGMFESVDGSYSDSLMMYDDGSHNDGAAGDGLYGNSMLAPMIEQEILTGLKTIDLDLNATTLRSDLDRFTTIGPLNIVTVTEMLRVTNRIYYQLELQNNGLTTAAQNVQAKITVSDPHATGILNDFQNFGTIAAGQTETSAANFGVTTVNLPDNHTFVFHVEIFSNGNLFWEDSTGVVVGLSELDNITPKVFSLKQNYPNPFNPKTTIEFSIPKSEFVELKIFDITGKEIQTLVSANMNTGTYQYYWQASESVASGIYFYIIKAGEYTDTKKLVLIK